MGAESEGLTNPGSSENRFTYFRRWPPAISYSFLLSPLGTPEVHLGFAVLC
jgi:hypothetical protein